MVRSIRKEESLIFIANEPCIRYQSRMLRAVDFMVPFRWRSECELIYSRPEKGTSLACWIRSRPDERHLQEFLEGVCQAFSALEGFLLDTDKIWWDPSWIYWEEERQKLRLVYLPWDQQGRYGVRFELGLSRLLWQSACRDEWQDDGVQKLVMEYGMWAQHPEKKMPLFRGGPASAADPSLWPQEPDKAERRQEMEQALDSLMTEENVPSESFFHRLCGKIRKYSPIEIKED